MSTLAEQQAIVHSNTVAIGGVLDGARKVPALSISARVSLAPGQDAPALSASLTKIPYKIAQPPASAPSLSSEFGTRALSTTAVSSRSDFGGGGSQTDVSGLSRAQRDDLMNWFFDNQKDKKAVLVLRNDKEKEEIRFTEFLVTGLQAPNAETVNVFDGFGMSIIQSFGKSMPSYTFTLEFVHNTRKPWFGDFSYIYDNFLRVSQLIRKGYRSFLFIGDDWYELAVYSFVPNQMAQIKYSVSAQMTAFIIDRTIHADTSRIETSSISDGSGPPAATTLDNPSSTGNPYRTATNFALQPLGIPGLSV